LVPNVALPIPDAYIAKAERWRSDWPELVFHSWPAVTSDTGEA
jgi:hypothetical protein